MTGRSLCRLPAYFVWDPLAALQYEGRFLQAGIYLRRAVGVYILGRLVFPYVEFSWITLPKPFIRLLAPG